MRERLLVLMLAAGALALFYVLFFPKPQARSLGLATGVPISTDGGPDGYLATWQWLGREHIPRVSLRLQYDHLGGLLPRRRGNVLLVTMPQQVATRAAELTALEDWVSEGNTLLIVAAIDDEPPWSIATLDSLMPKRLERVTGLRFTIPANLTSELRGSRARHLDIRASGTLPLLGNVRHLETPDYLSQVRRANAVGGQLPLELAARSNDGYPVIWLEQRGAGQVILCAVASLFSNAGIAHGDNAQLLANVIAWSRAPDGAVVFDDAHQGLTAFYDAKAFFADRRLHATLGWIVLIWLAFVLGPQPLRPVPRQRQRVDETAYVEASARYLAAVVRPADAARALIERFLDSFRARFRLDETSPDGVPPAIWQWLHSQPAVSADERRELQACYADACAGERVNLTRLQNLLAQLRERLQ